MPDRNIDREAESGAGRALVPSLSRPGEAAPKPRRAPAELGDIPFLIKRDGTWLYRGSPIERKAMVCLFAGILRRDAAGDWWLATPAERGRIQVEDAPFVAVELDWSGAGRTQSLSFRTNIDQLVTVDAAHPIRVEPGPHEGEPIPYVTIGPGAGDAAIEARVARPVYYELVALADTEVVDGRPMLGVWSEGCFFPLGDAPDEEDDP